MLASVTIIIMAFFFIQSASADYKKGEALKDAPSAIAALENLAKIAEADRNLAWEADVLNIIQGEEPFGLDTGIEAAGSDLGIIAHILMLYGKRHPGATSTGPGMLENHLTGLPRFLTPSSIKIKQHANGI